MVGTRKVLASSRGQTSGRKRLSKGETLGRQDRLQPADNAVQDRRFKGAAALPSPICNASTLSKQSLSVFRGPASVDEPPIV
jgi:hypothetical protein